MLKKIFKKLIKSKYKLIIITVIFFSLAVIVPGAEEVDEMIYVVFGATGLLFTIITGFFITDLWNRSQVIKDNVSIEVSGLQTYYLFAKVIGDFPRHKKWVKGQRELIDKYVRKFFDVEWYNYGKIDPYFNKIITSLKNVGELKTHNEIEIYAEMLRLLNRINAAREKLFICGKGKLAQLAWAVIYFLALVFLFSLFYINTHTIASILLVGATASAIIMLISILHDLNSLSYGEEMISFESYETIFDVIEKPRFYRKRDIEDGRVSLPKDKKYRLVE